MQVKNGTSENEGKKRKVAGIILACCLTVVWVAFQIFIIIFVWPAYLIKEQDLYQMIMIPVSAVSVLGFILPYFFLDLANIKDKKKRRHIFMVTLGITAITTLIGPLALQGVYQATKENIVITENTDVANTEIIDFTETDYLIDANELKQQLEVVGENDVIEVHFEQDVQPYVEVVKYCTTLTMDNQNPWGRKTTETIKEWTQYEFHLPASEASN